jgi:hypothetical protein
MGKREWRSEERKEAMSAPIRLPLIDVEVLASRGHTTPQIARIVLCDDDTVLRVLKRFLSGGLDAIPGQTSSGQGCTVTPAWESELVRMMEMDPHEVGILSAN